MNLKRSILSVFGAEAFGSLIMFVGIAVFANILSPEKLGIFFLFRGLVNILSFVGDLGIGGALEKRMSEGDAKSEKFTTAIVLIIPLLSLLVCTILYLKPMLTSYIGTDITYILILGLISEITYNTVANSLNGELKVAEVGKLDMVRRFIWFFGGVLLIWGGVGRNPLMYSYIIGVGVSAIAGISILNTSISFPRAETARSLFQYAKYDIVTGTGSKLYNWFDVLIIGAFLAPEFVAAYETAWAFSSTSIILGKAIQTTIIPQFSAWAAENKFNKIKESLDYMVIGALSLVIPSFFGVLAISEELLIYIYGREYAIAANVLIILMTVRITQAFGQTIGRTLNAIDRPDQAAYSIIIGGILNMSLNVVLVWKFGLIGAAIATFFSYVIVEWIRYQYLKSNIPVYIPVKRIGWCIFSSVVMLIVLLIIEEYYSITNIYSLLLMVSIGMASYTAIMYIHPFFRSIIRDYTLKLIRERHGGES